tara:strand:+ start:1863 stop:2528 length:666 start_codon:yes stop_codon:yes gene_type:complete
MKNWDKQYLETHEKRFNMTISYLKQKGVLKNNIKVLELGTPTVFTKMLKGRFDLDITNTNTDLRYDIPIQDKFDLVLCMELIEHIKDQDTDNFLELNHFMGSGVRNLVSECSRLAKKEGAVFISTPNLHCYKVFQNWCRGLDIYTYSPHPRELSIGYLKEILGEWFDLTIDYKNCWNCHGVNKDFMKLAKEFLFHNGFEWKNRDKGNIFIFAEPKKKKRGG